MAKARDTHPEGRDFDPGCPTKRPYRPAARLQLPEQDTDLAYLAGLIDGEGCITRKAQGQGSWIVSCAMKDKEVIDFLTGLGGAVYERQGQRQPDGYPRKVLWHWHLMRQRDVIAFLEAILPYMKLNAKKVKAAAAIAELQEHINKWPNRNT